VAVDGSTTCKRDIFVLLWASAAAKLVLLVE
jgi:hypothetical protein